MGRIPKISFDCFYWSFFSPPSIHDPMRDLMENFQTCSVDSSLPSYENMDTKTTATGAAGLPPARTSATGQSWGCSQCIATSHRHYASTATHHLLINSLHSPFPQSQFICLQRLFLESCCWTGWCCFALSLQNHFRTCFLLLPFTSLILLLHEECQKESWVRKSMISCPLIHLSKTEGKVIFRLMLQLRYSNNQGL